MPFQGNLSTKWFHPRCFCDKLEVALAERNGGKCYETKEPIAKGEARVGCPERKGNKPKWVKLSAAGSLASIVQAAEADGFSPDAIPGFAEHLGPAEQQSLLAAFATPVEIPVAAAGSDATPAKGRKRASPADADAGSGDAAVAAAGGGGADADAATDDADAVATPQPKKAKKAKVASAAKPAAGAPSRPVLPRQPGVVEESGKTVLSVMSWNVDGIRAPGR